MPFLQCIFVTFGQVVPNVREAGRGHERQPSTRRLCAALTHSETLTRTLGLLAGVHERVGSLLL